MDLQEEAKMSSKSATCPRVHFGMKANRDGNPRIIYKHLEEDGLPQVGRYPSGRDGKR
jgi:hypothetical protein